MHTHHRKFRIGLVAAAITLLAGCASAPSAPKMSFEQMQDPKITPKDKWSDAMIYLEAMRIAGMKDVPRELLETTSLEPARGGVLDGATAGLSAVSPPSHMSSGAAMGVGFGLMLLGGGTSNPVQLTQVAAWVPSDLASSPAEAAQVALNAFNEAREKTFKKRIQTKIYAATFPELDNRSHGGRFPVPSNLVLFSEEAKESPEFIKAPFSYGPIFLVDHHVRVEASKNVKGFMNLSGERSGLVSLSGALPDWFLIYDAARSFKQQAVPAVIMRKGVEHQFHGK